MPRFVPRQRKQKLQAKERSRNGRSGNETNQIQLLALSVEEKEAKRRKLKEELRAGESHVSSKKQKRLDKYIEKKLRKDETLDLLKKLSQEKFDTSHLQSSKHLGKRKRDQFAAGARPEEDVTLVNVQYVDSDDTDDSYLQSRDSLEVGRAEIRNGGKQEDHAPLDSSSKSEIVQGMGLRDPFKLDNDGYPTVRLGKTKATQSTVSEDSWEGFDNPDGEHQDRQLVHDPEKFAPAENNFEKINGGSGNAQISTDQSSDFTSTTDSEQDTEEENGGAGHATRARTRSSAFKTWALQQINKSVGHVPFQGTDYGDQLKPISKAVQDSVPVMAPIMPAIREQQTKPAEKKYTVLVARSMEVAQIRSQLPVVAEEQKIMEAIHDHQCVVICGATGSGKTTQVPQFLYETGYGSPDASTPGMIGVTQPRRVAAVSMAQRVSEELGTHGEKVSHQVRFESTTSQKTAIKFMTDGILLREITQDFALLKYSVIIVDEAHERSVNTDILIGMLSRIVDLRRKMQSNDARVMPLKLVIMSATLRISDFLQGRNLFPSERPPLIQAEGRLFPVTEHFSRHTQRDYLEEMFRKVSRGHRKLPPGGMLVFLTGQNEIKAFLKRLQDVLPSSNLSTAGSTKVQISATEAPLETDDVELDAGNGSQPAGEETNVVFLGHDRDDEDRDFDIGDPVSEHSSVHVLPLYSQLPTQEQLRVFQPPPDGSRLIVLATNVAETSLTIPGIRYVFDCGRSKERVYDPSTGVQQFEVGWISKSSAEQRAGRAGRTGPGHCYRLYSSAVYERDFVEHAEPEICRTSIESVVLQLKTMGIDNIVNFPFPTPPERTSLVKAENLLQNLGALDIVGQATALGRSLSIYPVSPRYGKMLAIGSQHGCLPYVIALVSALAVGDVFIPENQLDLHPWKRDEPDRVYTNEDNLEDMAREQRRKSYSRARAVFSKNDRTSDAVRLLSAVCASAYEKEGLDRFCQEMFLRSKAVKEISQLRRQLSEIVRANHPQLLGPFNPRLPPPSPKQVQGLNQIVAAAFIDQVAMRADLSAPQPSTFDPGHHHHNHYHQHRKPKRAIDVPYLCQTQRSASHQHSHHHRHQYYYYIHPSSLLARLPPQDLPQYLTFSHLQQAAPSVVNSDPNHSRQQPKIRIHPLTAISGLHVSALAHDTPLLTYGKPIGKVDSLGGLPERRECWVVPFYRSGSGSGSSSGGVSGWPLPARKVVQRRDVSGGGGGGGGVGRKGDGWIIERFLT